MLSTSNRGVAAKLHAGEASARHRLEKPHLRGRGCFDGVQVAQKRLFDFAKCSWASQGEWVLRVK